MKLDTETPTKYVGIKLRNMPFWIWFKTSNVSVQNTYFTGIDGDQTGSGLLFSKLTVKVENDEISGIIHSDSLYKLTKGKINEDCD